MRFVRSDVDGRGGGEMDKKSHEEESGRGRRVTLQRRKTEKATRNLKQKMFTTPAVFLLHLYRLLILSHWRKMWYCGNNGKVKVALLSWEEVCSTVFIR